MPIEGPRVIVALDYDNADECLTMAKKLDSTACRVKVGKELFTACGPDIIRRLREMGFDVFLDLKFHDIPSTVGKAVKMAAELGVWMVNVHASGGMRMMTAAREALEARHAPGDTNPLLIGVTVLTSMESADLQQTGIDVEPQEQVLRLASLTQAAGLDGVVCSAQEAPLLRQQLGNEFCLVTPGIRPEANAGQADDQRRILTPQQAVSAGSSYLVVGRPITRADDPAQACQRIVQSIQK